MASGKIAVFLCSLTNKARNLTILFLFTDGKFVKAHESSHVQEGISAQKCILI
jgi:hypothetical protein